MPINIGQEMALPMEQIIGGPMQALVKAQALSASTTADFIQQVGLQSVAGGGLVARTVEFSFNRSVVPEGSDTPKVDTVTLAAPLLTIVPVPWLRIKEGTIDFEAKVSSQTLSQLDSNFSLNASASGGFWGVKLSVNATYSRQSKFQDQVNRAATLTVHVAVVQDEMPAGLAKMLEILQTAVNDNQIVRST